MAALEYLHWGHWAEGMCESKIGPVCRKSRTALQQTKLMKVKVKFQKNFVIANERTWHNLELRCLRNRVEIFVLQI